MRLHETYTLDRTIKVSTSGSRSMLKPMWSGARQAMLKSKWYGTALCVKHQRGATANIGIGMHRRNSTFSFDIGTQHWHSTLAFNSGIRHRHWTLTLDIGHPTSAFHAGNAWHSTLSLDLEILALGIQHWQSRLAFPIGI